MSERSFGYVIDNDRPLRPAYPLLTRVSRAKPAVDLREWTPPVQDQEWTSSCTGQSGKVLFDTALKRNGVSLRSSARGLYTLALYALFPPGQPLQDSGAHYRAVFEQAIEFGIPSEADCPWDPYAVGKDAGFDTLVNGQAAKLAPEAWYGIDSEGEARHQEVQALLASGHAVGGAWAVKRGLTVHRGAIYDPDTDATDIAGNHAMALIGYDRDRYLLQNSWGGEFGEGGYVWVPRSFVERAFDLSVVLLLLFSCTP